MKLTVTPFDSYSIEKEDEIIEVAKTPKSKLILTTSSLLVMTSKGRDTVYKDIKLNEIKHIDSKNNLDTDLLFRVKAVPRILLSVAVISSLPCLVNPHAYINTITAIIQVINMAVIWISLAGLKHIYNLKQLGVYDNYIITIITLDEEVEINTEDKDPKRYEKIISYITNKKGVEQE